MLAVSRKYKELINAPTRSAKALITLSFNDEAAPLVSASFSKEGHSVDSVTVGRLSLDDTNVEGIDVPRTLIGPFKGWRSLSKANAQNIFTDAPRLSLEYSDERLTSNIWFVGSKEEYATDFTITVKNKEGKTTYLEEVVGNNRPIWNPVIPFPIKAKTITFDIHKINLPDRDALVLSAGIVDNIVLSDDELIDFDLLEELTSEEGIPYGGVSSNELTYAISNPRNVFSPSNMNGPLVGLLGPGVTTSGYAGLRIKNDTYEFVPLGTFTVAEWRAPSEGMDATITAYDRLYDLGQEKLPMLRIEKNTSIRKLFAKVFRALGLKDHEFIVDKTIETVIPYGFVTQELGIDALTTLCQAGVCRVAVDRYNRLVVKAVGTKATTVATWSDKNQIMNIDNPEKFNTIYGKIVVNINDPNLRRSLDLVSISNVNVPPGDFVLENTQFSKSPVLQVEGISLNDLTGVRNVSNKYGAGNIGITLHNPDDKPEQISLTVAGVYCDFVKREISKTVEGSKIKKPLVIDNELIQNGSHAQNVISAVTPYLSDTFAMFEIATRGNPALEIGDIVEFSSDVLKVYNQRIEIQRVRLHYDGSIEGDVVGRKVL